MAIIDELITVLGLENDGSVNRESKDYKKSLDSIAKTASKASLVVIGLVGALVTSMSRSSDELGKFAQQLGGSSQALQQMEFAAQRVGGSTQELRGDMEKLALQFGGLENADKIFLNIAKEMEGLSAAEQNLRGAEYGLSTTSIRLLQQGKEGLIALRKESERLRPALTDEDVQASAEYQDSLTNLSAVLGRVGDMISSFLTPIFTFFVRILTFAIDKAGGLIAVLVGVISVIASLVLITKGIFLIQKAFIAAQAAVIAFNKITKASVIITTIYNGVLKVASIVMAIYRGEITLATIATALYGKATKAMALVVAFTNNTIRAAALTLAIYSGTSKAAAIGVALFSTATKVATAFQWLFNAAVLANPIGLVIAAAVAAVTFLVLIIEDLWVAFTGGNSVIGTLIGWFVDGFANIWKAIKAWGAKVLNFIPDIVNGIMNFFGDLFTGKFHKAGFEFIFNIIKDWGGKILNFIPGIIDGIMDWFGNLFSGSFFSDGFDSIFGVIKEWGNSVLDFIPSIIDSIKQFFIDLFTGKFLIEGLKSLFDFFGGDDDDDDAAKKAPEAKKAAEAAVQAPEAAEAPEAKKAAEAALDAAIETVKASFDAADAAVGIEQEGVADAAVAEAMVALRAAVEAEAAPVAETSEEPVQPPVSNVFDIFGKMSDALINASDRLADNIPVEMPNLSPIGQAALTQVAPGSRGIETPMRAQDVINNQIMTNTSNNDGRNLTVNVNGAGSPAKVAAAVVEKTGFSNVSLGAFPLGSG